MARHGSFARYILDAESANSSSSSSSGSSSADERLDSSWDRMKTRKKSQHQPSESRKKSKKSSNRSPCSKRNSSQPPTQTSNVRSQQRKRTTSSSSSSSYSAHKKSQKQSSSPSLSQTSPQPSSPPAAPKQKHASSSSKSSFSSSSSGSSTPNLCSPADMPRSKPAERYPLPQDSVIFITRGHKLKFPRERLLSQSLPSAQHEQQQQQTPPSPSPSLQEPIHVIINRVRKGSLRRRKSHPRSRTPKGELLVVNQGENLLVSHQSHRSRKSSEKRRSKSTEGSKKEKIVYKLVPEEVSEVKIHPLPKSSLKRTSSQKTTSSGRSAKSKHRDTYFILLPKKLEKKLAGKTITLEESRPSSRASHMSKARNEKSDKRHIW
ncbi:unnamed protein product [Rodentolepis nana]|uniref:Serine/arginine repetitive matrix protein 2 n=1 Tax=Rodentolepis nana TaxID=102285 RepID=A0A0R3T4S8_RODNA|nr:unnamed protein product [Rodentolepis nana]